MSYVFYVCLREGTDKALAWPGLAWQLIRSCTLSQGPRQVVAEEAAAGGGGQEKASEATSGWPAWVAADLLAGSGEDSLMHAAPAAKQKEPPSIPLDGPVGREKVDAAMSRALKALAQLSANDVARQQQLLEAGVLHLLRHVLLEMPPPTPPPPPPLLSSSSTTTTPMPTPTPRLNNNATNPHASSSNSPSTPPPPPTTTTPRGRAEKAARRMRRQALRLLAFLSAHKSAAHVMAQDAPLQDFLRNCAQQGLPPLDTDAKVRGYALRVLQHIATMEEEDEEVAQGGRGGGDREQTKRENHLGISMREGSRGGVPAGHRQPTLVWPRFEDGIFMCTGPSPPASASASTSSSSASVSASSSSSSSSSSGAHSAAVAAPRGGGGGPGNRGSSSGSRRVDNAAVAAPVMDVVFVHGLQGGPFKTWRTTTSQSISTSSEAAAAAAADIEGGMWPTDWLAPDLPNARLLTIKYKTSLSEWSGKTLPLMEVSQQLLGKLIAAGVGTRPVVFVTHSMGGLVVKQMLSLALDDANYSMFLDKTIGIVFYSTPHSGSRLADLPWTWGHYVFRPAPTIAELSSRSPRLEDLNRKLRVMHQQQGLAVLSFSESKATPVIEGYGGYALRLEVVPVESAFPGFGDIVVLEGADHVNACKPLSRADPAYVRALEFLKSMAEVARRDVERSRKE